MIPVGDEIITSKLISDYRIILCRIHANMPTVCHVMFEWKKKKKTERVLSWIFEYRIIFG